MKGNGTENPALPQKCTGIRADSKIRYPVGQYAHAADEAIRPQGIFQRAARANNQLLLLLRFAIGATQR